MPSFDICSKVDVQTLDNAINVVKKEIANRFDFRGTHFEMELDKKNFLIKVEADSDMKMQQVVDVILSRGIKQGIDGNAFDFSKEAYPSGKITKKEVMELLNYKERKEISSITGFDIMPPLKMEGKPMNDM